MMMTYNLPTPWDTSWIWIILTALPIIAAILFIIWSIIWYVRHPKDGGSGLIEVVGLMFLAILFMLTASGATSSFYDAWRQAVVSQTQAYVNNKYDVNLDTETVTGLLGERKDSAYRYALEPDQFSPSSSEYNSNAIYGTAENYDGDLLVTYQLVKSGGDLKLLVDENSGLKEAPLRE